MDLFGRVLFRNKYLKSKNSLHHSYSFKNGKFRPFERSCKPSAHTQKVLIKMFGPSKKVSIAWHFPFKSVDCLFILLRSDKQDPDPDPDRIRNTVFNYVRRTQQFCRHKGFESYPGFLQHFTIPRWLFAAVANAPETLKNNRLNF